jgi:hypothetical protein
MTAPKERGKLKPKAEKDTGQRKPAGQGKPLPDEALEEVSAGLNPQPLPPRIMPT